MNTSCRSDRKSHPGPSSPARRRFVQGAVAGLVLPCLSGPVAAAGYPARPVRVLVGQAPGGPSDIVARIVAEGFAQHWKVAVVVENHPGATGMIAGRMLASAPADGYTLLSAGNSLIASASMDMQTAGYDPRQAFAPVGRIARGGYVLAVRSGLGVKTVREFVALADARAESVTFSTVGGSSNSARGLALFQRIAGIRALEIPFNGGALAVQAVVAGHVDATFCELALALPFAESGAMRILAAASRQRLPLAPDLPTFAEIGYPGVMTESWYGILVPTGTPAAVIAELVATLHATLANTEVQRRYRSLGCETIVETPEDFAAAIRLETEQAREVTERQVPRR